VKAGTVRSSPPQAWSRALLLLLPATAFAAFPFFSTFTTAKLLVAGLVLAPLLPTVLRPWRRKGHSASPDLLTGFYLLYLLLSAPAFLASRYAHESLLLLHLDFVGLAVYLVAREVARDGSLMLRIARWIAAAGLGVFAFFLLEKLFPDGPFTLGVLRGSSMLGNPDFVAEYFACLLPVALFMATRPLMRDRICGALLGGAALYLLATLQSMTAILAGGVGLLVGAAAWWVGVRPEEKRYKRLLRSRLAGPAAAIVVLALVCGAASAALLTAGGGRLHLFSVSTECALEAPVKGHGVGAFPAVFMRKQGERMAAVKDRETRALWTNAKHAHNEFLQQWVERGVLPLLALLLFIGAHLLSLLRRKQAHIALTVSVLAAASVAFLGSVTYNQVPMRVLYFLFLGLCATGPFRAGQSVPESRVRPLPCRLQRLAGWTRAALVIAVAAYLAIYPLWAATADFLFTRGDYDHARCINPYHGRTAFFLGIRKMEEGDLDSATRLLEESARRHPNLSTLLMLGNCHTRTGRFEAAERWYRKCLSWKPTYSPAFANLAVMYHRQGRLEMAYRHIVRALSLSPSNQGFRRIRKKVCRENRFCLER